MASGPMPRQMVNFTFYKLDAAFRRLPQADKDQARDQYLEILTKSMGIGTMCLSYSSVGLRGDADFLLWRIAPSLADFQTQTRALNKTTLAGYLSTPHTFLAMTKRSIYLDKHDPFFGVEDKSHIVPGQRKYLFVYPLIKIREWYLLPTLQRQEMIETDNRVSNQFPSVKAHTTYSFGLDDQDSLVVHETDEPRDFLDLAMELRKTESSRYTQSDIPAFTCIRAPMKVILDQLF